MTLISSRKGASGKGLGLLAVLVGSAMGGPVLGQAPDPPFPTEQVSYRNAVDSTYLTGTLTLPAGEGPHAGVVLLSIAGPDPMVNRLAELGYAVLLPVRRGFVAVEPLLQASYDDLANDAQAALDYLGSRPDVDASAMAMIGQADDAPPAMLAASASPVRIPLVLLAPPAFTGREVFRLEQRGLADRPGVRREALEALDGLTGEIADIVLSEQSPYFREARLRTLMARSSVRLPYNAAFPHDDSQTHFFASPLWHDRLAFEPEQVLAQLHGPVLVLIGTTDRDTPLMPYLDSVRRGLAEAGLNDSTACSIGGRTRHAFTDDVVSAVEIWLGGRVAVGGGQRTEPGGERPSWCLEDPEY